MKKLVYRLMQLAAIYGGVAAVGAFLRCTCNPNSGGMCNEPL